MCSIESSLKGFIVGVEITIEGYPAPLVYCAHITIKDIDVLRELESLLQKVRIYEEMAVKEAYNKLGFLNESSTRRMHFLHMYG